ncbi:MAG: peptidase M75 [Bacteroidaceae bacterium]|nr:peptidase M75 [Bacteroidaceae bacterium]
MKKNYLLMGLLCLGLGVAAVSCSKDDDEKKTEDTEITEEEAQNLDYTSENAAAWGNYAVNVAKLLTNDSQSLYDAWNDEFADAFKNHTSASGYFSAKDCVEEIIQGCIEIANEVGTAKIGEPYDYWKAGKTNQALYAVESWYSWHSRDDYKNNILSIINSICGERFEGDPNNINYQNLSSPSIMYNFMLKGVETGNRDLLRQAGAVYTSAIAAWNAIDAIPQPFRNNIGSQEAEAAMDSCEVLVNNLEALNGLVDALGDDEWEAEFQEIVNQFVDVVAVPTYADLKNKNNTLLSAVQALQKNPTNQAFETACQAWLDARQPWESSEAFLFGPVAELGLDPNMDSWPLDAVGIANLLKSQKWSEMEWTGEYDEESEAIEAAQSLRGFHTLEFLLFKDGKPRTVK